MRSHCNTPNSAILSEQRIVCMPPEYLLQFMPKRAEVLWVPKNPKKIPDFTIRDPRALLTLGNWQASQGHAPGFCPDSWWQDYDVCMVLQSLIGGYQRPAFHGSQGRLSRAPGAQPWRVLASCWGSGRISEIKKQTTTIPSFLNQSGGPRTNRNNAPLQFAIFLSSSQPSLPEHHTNLLPHGVLGCWEQPGSCLALNIES